MFPDSNARRRHRRARILHDPIFSFFGWLETQLEGRKYNGEDELQEQRMKF
jgi:hypothetical protein